MLIVKVIINTLLIILGFHLLLRFFSGGPTERFIGYGYSDPQKSFNEDYGDVDNLDSAYEKELKDYTFASPDTLGEKVVLPGNYFTVEDNQGSSNFKSNVLDLRQFYNYNGTGDKQIMSAKAKPVMMDKISKQTMYINEVGANVKELCPDMWKYQNELAMNGGKIFGNVHGYDEMNDGLAIFDKKRLNIEKCDIGCKIPANDDVRFGLGIPNWLERTRSA